jgi:hypothetical protein
VEIFCALSRGDIDVKIRASAKVDLRMYMGQEWAGMIGNWGKWVWWSRGEKAGLWHMCVLPTLQERKEQQGEIG